MVRIRNYTAKSLKEMDEWLTENTTGPFKRLGWRSGCATMIGIACQTTLDAVFIRLRWGD